MNSIKKPFWHSEFEVFGGAVNTIILEGNVMDRFMYPEDRSIMSLREYIYLLLMDSGYECVVFYNRMNGFSCYEGALGKRQFSVFEKISGAGIGLSETVVPFSAQGDKKTAANYIYDAMLQTETTCAVIMEMASRYIVSPDSLTQDDTDSFNLLQKAGQSAAVNILTPNGKKLNNLMVLVVNKLNDLPVWFYHSNPNIRPITVGRPDREFRSVFVDANFHSFFSTDRWNEGMKYYADRTDELAKLKKRVVTATEGLMFADLISISKICSDRNINIKDVNHAVDIFKYGIVDQNPWTKIAKNTIDDLRFTLNSEIIGQSEAMEHIMSVIERAYTGISNFFDEDSSKPKGVLFFAGPTGTGKTKTAKLIAKALFNSERACRIFDMSEYSAPNSDQRLLGAPPGYVGYEAGGQLTNAARENPFSIFLFDEIEKADPSILDKFLQILGDGRLTDGLGRTVYFSDSLIIFTSNLGIYEVLPDGSRSLRIDPTIEGNDYQKVKDSVTNAISNYFQFTLNRSEILNRIGKNIVVFDFIRNENIAKIVDLKLEQIAQTLQGRKGIRLRLRPNATVKLKSLAAKETMSGGRGIENMLELVVINNISTFLYRNNLAAGSAIEILDIECSGSVAVPNIRII